MEVYKVSALHKRYKELKVLEDLNISFKAGEFVALLGANGSGKSTFLRLLAQEEHPTSGAVLYHQQDLHDIRVNCREDVLFINENHWLPMGISLDAWAETFAKQYVRYDMPLFHELLKRFDIGKERVFSSLSRGQKMKALFALQAPKKPSVYLIDEITSVLDVGSRLELMTFLKKEVASGALVVMTTNIGSELQAITTDVCFLYEGKIVLNCKKADIKNRFTKYRSLDPDMEEAMVASAAKLIHVNSDGSKSFLVVSGTKIAHPGVLIDKREVTVEDVAVFYSVQEVLHGNF